MLLTRQTLQALSVQQFCLPLVVALVETPEHAVELLGLAHQAPLELTGWMAHWQSLTDLRYSPEAELDAERFAAAWERGARLDLDSAVDTLLADLASG